MLLSKEYRIFLTFFMERIRNGCQGEALLHRLDLMGIAVSTGSACDSKRTVISHVLKSMSVPEEIAQSTIRISLGVENTIVDVEAIVNALHRILKKD